MMHDEEHDTHMICTKYEHFISSFSIVIDPRQLSSCRDYIVTTIDVMAPMVKCAIPVLLCLVRV